MASFRGGQWLIGLTAYFIIYYLILYSYTATRLQMSDPDACISYDNTAFDVQPNSKIKPGNIVSEVTGLASMFTTLKFAFGFNTGYHCLGDMGWIFLLFFSYLPGALLTIALFMNLELIIAVASSILSAIGGLIAGLLAFLGL